MVEDDHYISNVANSSIDTSNFESELLAKLTEPGRDSDELLESIYHRIFSKTNITPERPSDDQLICRYLSIGKFLRFLDTRRIDFPIATQFTDHWECRVPRDYENAVLRVLGQLDLDATSWMGLVRLKAADWNVSCWTKLNDYFDDHLLWSAYAGGRDGVGVTIRYGVFEDFLKRNVGPLDRDGSIYCGNVSYERLSLLPFNKHHMFRGEKEVRFAFRAAQPRPKAISVDEIFHLFGVRISPAADVSHYDRISRLWLQYGGEDRINWPQ